MTTTPIKTAVIGYGLSAKTFHLPFIEALAEFELCAISTSQTEQLKQEDFDHLVSLTETIKDEELFSLVAPHSLERYSFISEKFGPGKLELLYELLDELVEKIDEGEESKGPTKRRRLSTVNRFENNH